MPHIYDNADAILMLNKHEDINCPLAVASIYVSNSVVTSDHYNRDVIIDLVDSLSSPSRRIKIFGFESIHALLEELTIVKSLAATMIAEDQFELRLIGDGETHIISHSLRLEIENLHTPATS